jgi:hypothetical protein
MSQTSKVDKILEEIYLEMEEEEISELLETDFSLLSEENAAAGIARLTAAQGAKLKQIAQARKLGNSELAKTLTKGLLSIKQKLSALKSGAGAMAGKVMSTDVGKTVAKGAKAAVTKGAEYAGKAKGMVTAQPEAAAAAAVIATVAAAVVIYKKFFAQAARACKGKSGSDKANCVSSFKVRGLQAAKAKVASGMAKCKTPKCKAKLQSKIQGFDAKISAMKGKVSESIMDKYINDYISELKELRSKN